MQTLIPFIIHNPDRVDRRNLLTKELTDQGISTFELIGAEMIPKFPQRGISRSHKKAIRLAQALNKPECLTGEDDLMFLGKGAYKRFLEVYEKEIPEDGDILISGAYDGLFTPITDRIASVEGRVSGLHLYIVKERFYEKLLSANEDYNIDYLISSPDHLNAKIYCTYPFLCLQHDTFSDNTKKVTGYNQAIGTRFKLWDGK